jgi:hypothetical protein
MNIQELMLIFDAAYCANLDDPDTRMASDTAGVRAVVLALRDELVATFRQEVTDDVFSETLLNACAVGMLDDILGDVLEKAATHSSPELDEDARKLEAMGQDAGPTIGECFEPAADPSPQCEWTIDGGIDEDAHYETACGDAWCSVLGGTPKQDNYSFCPSCGLPIKFKEPSHD